MGLNVFETAWEGHKTRQLWFSGESHGVTEREGGREGELESDTERDRKRENRE